MDTQKSTISACLVVYKEENLIRRCLESVKDVVDEIIVVHDGPALDRTMEIAAEYTDKVFTRPFVGEAEPHRVFSFEQSSGDWILQIDADEFLSVELQDSIRSITELKEYDRYSFLWKQWDGQKYITHKGPYKPCFFRRSAMHYIGVPHFQAWVDGHTKQTEYLLEHRPAYDNFSWSAFYKKRFRFAKVQAEYLNLPFDKVPRFQYPDSDWPNKYKWKIQYPWLAMVTLPAHNFWSAWVSSRFSLELSELKRAAFEAFYILLVYTHLLRLKF